jgi:hypothetical protein
VAKGNEEPKDAEADEEADDVGIEADADRLEIDGLDLGGEGLEKDIAGLSGRRSDVEGVNG